MTNIKIGPHFFKNEFDHYANWHLAYIREAAQNSLDTPHTTKFEFTANEVDGDTIVSFTNDGDPMDEDVLVNKLLALGESGKNFVGDGEGTVGGFGKAKILLYMSHKSYAIRTGTLEVRGAGGEYDLIRDLPYFHGTRSEVVMAGGQSDKLGREFEKFCCYGQWSGTMTWNGKPVVMNMRKGNPRRELGFASVYTNKQMPYRMVVRMGGIPMFVQSINLDRCVVVELCGKSDQILTANRDGLKYPHSSQLSNFVTELAVDKRSALKARNPKYRHYDGSRLCHRKIRENVFKVSDILDLEAILQARDDLADELADDECGPITRTDSEVSTRGSTKAAALVASQVERVNKATIGDEFVIKNDTDMVIPTYYRPDETDFSSYSRKLARIWGRLMLQMHRTFDVEAEFAIGFIFADDKQLAEHEKGQFGTVYYIAPARLVEQSSSRSKSWQKQWKLTDRNQLIMTALHEFVHGGGGRCDMHDEEYANRLTDVAAKLMDNKKDFTWCFQ